MEDVITGLDDDDEVQPWSRLDSKLWNISRDCCFFTVEDEVSLLLIPDTDFFLTDFDFERCWSLRNFRSRTGESSSVASRWLCSTRLLIRFLFPDPAAWLWSLCWWSFVTRFCLSTSLMNLVAAEDWSITMLIFWACPVLLVCSVYSWPSPPSPASVTLSLTSYFLEDRVDFLECSVEWTSDWPADMRPPSTFFSVCFFFFLN